MEKNKRKISHDDTVVKYTDNVKYTNIKFKENLKNVQEILREYYVPEDASHIKVVLEKMQERLEYYIKILIQILQPEEFHSLHECTIFDDSEKTRIFEMYKNMMILHREIVKSEIKNDEKDMVATINYAHSELKKFKPEMIEIINKMQDSWKRPGTNGRVRYFG